MKTIFTDKVRPGMILARPVVSAVGSVLLDADIVLTQQQIDSLKKWNIAMVQIEENLVRLKEPEPVLPTTPAATEFPLEELMPETFGLPLNVKTAPPPRLKLADIDKTLSGRIFGGGMKPRVRPVINAFVYDAEKIARLKETVAKLHQVTQKSTVRVMGELTNYRPVEKEEILRIVNKLVEEATRNKDILTNLTTIKNSDNYLLTHSINVCILAVVTGFALGLDRTELLALGEGGLLHDIGMAKIPWHIWNRDTVLTELEHLEVQKHTILGADMLLATGGLSRAADIIAYQHHERLDGSGYPKGENSNRIHEFSRIIAVVDVFEAMTSPRKYRPKMPGNQAISFLLVRMGTCFDADVVRTFIRHMSLFPIGSLLELSTGSLGMVIAANPDHPLRPLVKLIKNETGAPAAPGTIVDLLKETGIGIKEISDSTIDAFSSL